MNNELSNDCSGKWCLSINQNAWSYSKLDLVESTLYRIRGGWKGWISIELVTGKQPTNRTSILIRKLFSVVQGKSDGYGGNTAKAIVMKLKKFNKNNASTNARVTDPCGLDPAPTI